VTVQASANQTIFEDATTTIVGEPPDWPIFEGRVAWTVGERGQGCLPVTVGVSGPHRRGTVRPARSSRQAEPHLVGNVDLRVPLSDRFGFQGECQVGENLGAFLGGIGQGTDPTGLNGIRDVGGWFEFWYDWSCCLHSHVGYSIDDPNNHDLHTVGERTYNQFYYGNLVYDLTKELPAGGGSQFVADALPGPTAR